MTPDTAALLERLDSLASAKNADEHLQASAILFYNYPLLAAEIRRLNAELEQAKLRVPLFSRRQLEAKAKELIEFTRERCHSRRDMNCGICDEIIESVEQYFCNAPAKAGNEGGKNG